MYLFLVYLSISTCFGRFCAHHQEKQLSLCDTLYLLFYVDDWYAYQTVIARNMYRLINILIINIQKINCAPSWLYLQDYTGMQVNKTKYILILSSNLHLGLPSGLFPSGFPVNTLYEPLFSPELVTYPTHLILLDFIIRKIFGEAGIEGSSQDSFYVRLNTSCLENCTHMSGGGVAYVKFTVETSVCS